MQLARGGARHALAGALRPASSPPSYTSTHLPVRDAPQRLGLVLEKEQVALGRAQGPGQQARAVAHELGVHGIVQRVNVVVCARAPKAAVVLEEQLQVHARGEVAARRGSVRAARQHAAAARHGGDGGPAVHGGSGMGRSGPQGWERGSRREGLSHAAWENFCRWLAREMPRRFIVPVQTVKFLSCCKLFQCQCLPGLFSFLPLTSASSSTSIWPCASQKTLRAHVFTALPPWSPRTHDP